MDYVRFRNWPAACKHQSMVKKIISGMILAAGLAVSASAADVYVRIGPPRPIVERRPISPARGYVWVPGYHNWDGRSYVWVAGRWEQPPRARARWQKHHWVKQRGGWVLVEGRWR